MSFLRIFLRIRFRLRMLLGVMLVGSVVLGLIGRERLRVHRQQAAVRKIEARGGIVAYDYQVREGSVHLQHPPVTWSVTRLVFGDTAFAYIEVVSFIDSSDASDEDLGVLRSFSELRDVLLRGPGFTDAGMDELSLVPHLRAVSLNNTNVSVQGIAKLRSANELVSLSLCGASVNDEILAKLQSLPSLQYLQVVQANVTNEGVEAVCCLNGLRELDLIDLPSVDHDGLRSLAKLNNLQAIGLYHVDATDSTLAALGQLTKLRSIAITGAALTDSGLAPLSGLSELTHLNLIGEDIGDKSMPTLGTLEKLRVLQLRDTMTTDMGLSALDDLKELDYLSVGPEVSLEAAQNFSTRRQNCWIEYLDDDDVLTWLPQPSE